MGLLLYAEHRYSYSPSMLSSMFLSITALLDIAIIRSLFLRRTLVALSATTSAAVAIKLVLLVLEEFPKQESVRETSKEFSSGLWNRSVFWWLNATFRRGFKAFLQVEDLSKLDKKLGSQYLAARLGQQWRAGKRSDDPPASCSSTEPGPSCQARHAFPCIRDFQGISVHFLDCCYSQAVLHRVYVCTAIPHPDRHQQGGRLGL